MKEIKQAIMLLQRVLKILSMKGDSKHTRYIRGAIVSLQTYQKLKDSGQLDRTMGDP